MLRIQLTFMVLLACSKIAHAQDSIRLTEFLSQANEIGIGIIYSSDLISSQMNVLVDLDEVITVAKVEQLLTPYGLELQKLNASDIYLVVRVVSLDNPALTASPAPEAELVVLPALEPKIEEIVVTASLLRLLVRNDASGSSLGHSELLERPAIGNDPLRLVNQLPGSASSGISARPYVRGGNISETRIEYDGVRLYDPFHVNSYNSLFGGFDSRVLDSLDFHSGGFTAKYGDSLSAAMLVNSREPEELGNIREMGVGLFNFSYLQAHTDGDRDWLLNIRRSSLELASGLVEADLGSPKFADLFARYGWNFDNGDRISLNLFWLGDDNELQNASSTENSSNIYSNTYTWLTAENTLSDSLSATSIASFSTIKNDRKGRLDKAGISTGSLTDQRRFEVYGLKQDLNYSSNSNWIVNFGWDYKLLNVEYDYQSSLDIDPLFQAISNYPRLSEINTEKSERGQQLSAYGSIRWVISDQLIAETGIRYDNHRYLDSSDTTQIDPRASIRYLLTDSTVLRIGWGEFSQAEGIQELKISDGLTTFQATQQSTQLILGVDQELGSNFNLRIEAYRNRGPVSNVYFQNLTNSLSLLPELEPDRVLIRPDHFESQGLEVSLSGRWRYLDLWANYSYSSTKDEFNGVEIRRSWDQAHSSNLGVSTSIGQWRVALTGSSHQGWLTTPLLMDEGMVSSGARNSLRFTRYVNWDLKLICSWNIGQDELRLEAGLSNLSDRANQIATDYELNNGALEASFKTGIPIAPFIDLYWRF